MARDWSNFRKHSRTNVYRVSLVLWCSGDRIQFDPVETKYGLLRRDYYTWLLWRTVKRNTIIESNFSVSLRIWSDCFSRFVCDARRDQSKFGNNLSINAVFWRPDWPNADGKCDYAESAKSFDQSLIVIRASKAIFESLAIADPIVSRYPFTIKSRKSSKDDILNKD